MLSDRLNAPSDPISVIGVDDEVRVGVAVKNNVHKGTTPLAYR